MKDLASRILSRKQSGAEKAARKNNPNKPKVTTGKVLKYMFLPDFGSRIRSIGKRLGGFAYFLAQIFYSCRLIPAGHPVLNPANIGYFGFSDVISTAAANLELRKENTDQIVMFAGVVISMVLLIANGLAIAAYTVFDMNDAMAQTYSTAGSATTTAGTGVAQTGNMFAAPNPTTDLALQFLDRVFGASNVTLFNAGGATSSSLGSPAIKEALYTMLGLYSTSMMVIAVIIVLYYAFTIVGESAMTGQPFGKRFNSFWAPIRLVIGLGLLVPLAGGLNAAQYTTLYAAKLGSGLASYAWTGFVQKLANSDLIAEPGTPLVSGLVSSVMRFETCRALENIYGDKRVERKEIDDDNGTYIGWTTSGSSDREEIERDAICGSILIDKTVPTVSDATTNKKAIVPNLNTTQLSASYKNMVLQLSNSLRTSAETLADHYKTVEQEPSAVIQNDDSVNATASTLATSTIIQATNLNKTAVDAFKNTYKQNFQSDLQQNISKLSAYGWMGAGMFYNQIADLNGTLIGAINNTFPQIVGDVRPQGMGSDNSSDSKAIDETARIKMLTQQKIEDIFGKGTNPEVATHNNGKASLTSAKGIISYLLGWMGGDFMVQFRTDTPTNPLASLSAVGKGFVDKASTLMLGVALSMGGSIVGGLAGLAGGLATGVAAGAVTGPGAAISGMLGGALGAAAGVAIGGIMKALGGIFITIALIGMAVGILLYYVIPLLPFLYFFFAVVSWILDVMEAMVGLPLWALSHLRIDGDGIMGASASFGYHAIFGIIIRPMIILFGLIVGIILFSSGMMMLHEMFSFFVGSIHGGEQESMDFIAFSAVYTMMAYSLALLCFKQSDQMPQSIMRWFGVSETRYNDGQPDPAGNMTQNTLIASGAASKMVADSMNQGISGVGQAFGSSISTYKGAKPQPPAPGSSPNTPMFTAPAGGGSGAGAPASGASSTNNPTSNNDN